MTNAMLIMFQKSPPNMLEDKNADIRYIADKRLFAVVFSIFLRGEEGLNIYFLLF